MIALLKPGKDSSSPKSYCPIFLLIHLYKLLERLLLNRLIPVAEKYLIEEQTGFSRGKSNTGYLLNLTQHTEDGFHKKITGAVFEDLSAAYDTVNHRLLLKKVLDTTNDQQVTQFLGENAQEQTLLCAA